MNNIYVTSDLHFNHDKNFIWQPRGYCNVQEMNEDIVRKWNLRVDDGDTVYVLGDIMLGSDTNEGMRLFNSLNGEKIIILGNHDSAPRIEAYQESGYETDWAKLIKYKGYNLYLSHYPTFTANADDYKRGLKGRVINLCGHSHVRDPLVDMPKGLIYHVEMDAHHCMPVLLDEAIFDVVRYVAEAKAQMYL